MHSLNWTIHWKEAESVENLKDGCREIWETLKKIDYKGLHN